MDGSDTFVVDNNGGDGVIFQTFDLYDWIHLTREERALHLITYARRLGKSDGTDPQGIRVECIKTIEMDIDLEDVNGFLKKIRVEIPELSRGTAVRKNNAAGNELTVKWDNSLTLKRANGNDLEFHEFAEIDATDVEEQYLLELTDEWQAFLEDERLEKDVGASLSLESRMRRRSLLSEKATPETEPLLVGDIRCPTVTREY